MCVCGGGGGGGVGVGGKGGLRGGGWGGGNMYPQRFNFSVHRDSISFWIRTAKAASTYQNNVTQRSEVGTASVLKNNQDSYVRTECGTLSAAVVRFHRHMNDTS